MKYVILRASSSILPLLFAVLCYVQLPAVPEGLPGPSTGVWHLSVHLDMSMNTIVFEGHPEQGKVREVRIYDVKKHLLRCFTHHASAYSIQGLPPGAYLLVVDYGVDAYVQVIEIPEEGPEEMPPAEMAD